MKKNGIADGVQEIMLSSWAEFDDLVNNRFLKGPAFIYRGQADYQWPLEASLDRHERTYHSRKYLGPGTPKSFSSKPLRRDQQLSAFRHAIRGKRGRHPETLDDDQCWALGQHYGLKTPLLDWTLSPYAALFFAFEQAKVLKKHDGKECLVEPESRAVYAFSTSALEDKQPERPVELSSPATDENVRLFGQASLFLKMPQGRDLEAYVRKQFCGEDKMAYLIKVEIPDAGRDECLITLNKMNINYMTVYPDLEGAAKHVNSLWQPGHEDLIAWLGGYQS